MEEPPSEVYAPALSEPGHEAVNSVFQLPVSRRDFWLALFPPHRAQVWVTQFFLAGHAFVSLLLDLAPQFLYYCYAPRLSSEEDLTIYFCLLHLDVGDILSPSLPLPPSIVHFFIGLVPFPSGQGSDL